MGEYCNPWKVFGYVSLLYFFYNLFGFTLSTLLVASLIHFTDGLKDLKYAKKIIIRDIGALIIFLTKFVPTRKALAKESLNAVFLKSARKNPNKKALIEGETGRSMTFKEVEEFINKLGHVFKKAGYKPGDKVALFMGNEIEYVPIWMGLKQIGVGAGLINCNLYGKSLEHCLTVTEFKGVICSPNLKHFLDNINISEKMTVYVFGEAESTVGSHENLEELIKDESNSGQPEEYISGEDECIQYLYTSGSTGKPKAARVTEPKMKLILSFTAFTELNSDDVIYIVLPLYHGTGGLLLMGAFFLYGSTTVIRKKFSASNFFGDCIKYDVTFTGYVGEVWKYLLAQPPSSNDRNHKIKSIMGNGLRSSLAPEVTKRFGIKKIFEFYGASEGNSGLINLDSTPGAVGFYFKLFPFVNMNCLVRADVETGELIRDENGRAILCKPFEKGTFISVITNKTKYCGYENNEKESERKIARNVFKEGDAAFLSGDLLVMDEYHYVYFVDRIGDTFRWKSENVSTTEVENIMSSVVKSAEDVVVYPVPIPGESGNAGMAYIREKTDEKFSIEGLAKALLEELPKYAIPMFIRVGSSLDQTGTFKYQKSVLKKENYDLKSVEDSVYVYDVTKKDYIMLDSEILTKIKNEEMKF